MAFTYLRPKTDATTAVRFNDEPSENLFVAGEMGFGSGWRARVCFFCCPWQIHSGAVALRSNVWLS
jgi:hypothetical protein